MPIPESLQPNPVPPGYVSIMDIIVKAERQILIARDARVFGLRALAAGQNRARFVPSNLNYIFPGTRFSFVS